MNKTALIRTGIVFLVVLLVIVAGCFLVGFVGGSSMPVANPPGGPITKTHIDPDNPNYQTLSQETTFDLRSWRPEALESGSWSAPVVMTDSFLVRKTGPSTRYNSYYATHGTGIDLTCLTHPYSVEIQAQAHDYMGKDRAREYVVALSDKNTSVGSSERIGIRGVFYNAFKAKDEASTYTDEVIRPDLAVKLIVLLPDLPLKSLAYTWHPVGDAKPIPLRLGEDATVIRSADGRRIQMSITRPKGNCVYSVNYEFANGGASEARALAGTVGDGRTGKQPQRR